MSFPQVQGQSASVNVTIGDVESIKKSVLTTLSRPFNALRDDVGGHFFRSQNTLRNARQAIFMTASTFPYHMLSNDTRHQLVSNLTKLLTECADPTIDYLQKASMLRFYNFMSDAKTPIETALQPVVDQLNTLEQDLKSAKNQSCLASVKITQRGIQTAYSNFTEAVNNCTRKASQAYRAPISEFTRVHFMALPLLNKVERELSACNSNNVKDSCVLTFLSKFCAEDSCKVCSTM